MAKNNFSKINVKAAAITGAVLGFLCWLLIIPYGYSGYGLMGYMIGYGPYAVNGTHIGNMMGYGSNIAYNGTYRAGIFQNYGLLSILLVLILGAIVTILGAIAGVVIALVYNWALKLK